MNIIRFRPGLFSGPDPGFFTGRSGSSFGSRESDLDPKHCNSMVLILNGNLKHVIVSQS